MNILVVGGTRFFGIPMVNKLLEKGHEITIATRGKASDPYGDKVQRIILERTNPDSIKETLSGRHFDVVIDKIAYCSNDIKYVMDVINCDRYIYMSSTAVYSPKALNTKEEDFNAVNKELIWCSRTAFPYAEIKRQAECALWQVYPHQNWVAVRYPFVIGEDDYTKRLLFYVEHILNSKPMYIDNLNCQMGFIRSDEAGEFMAYLVDKAFKGAVNGCSTGTISLREIIDYVEAKTGCTSVLSETGEPAPYNGETEYSINTEKAESLGYQFSCLNDWIYKLLDYYIEKCRIL